MPGHRQVTPAGGLVPRICGPRRGSMDWEARLRTAEDLAAEADRVGAELALVRHEAGTD